MIFVAAALAGLGLVSILMKRSLLGVLIGIQLLFLSGSTVFVLAGEASGDILKGHLCALFIAFSGVAVLVVGYALSIRLFYLKKNAGMDEIRSLKH